MKSGNIVYFKKAKLSPFFSTQAHDFPGFGFGLLLGTVPENVGVPPALLVYRLLGSIGYIKFDDLEEFLGRQVVEDVVKKFETKYSELSLAKQPELPVQPNPSPLLVGADGKPLPN